MSNRYYEEYPAAACGSCGKSLPLTYQEIYKNYIQNGLDPDLFAWGAGETSTHGKNKLKLCCKMQIISPAIVATGGPAPVVKKPTSRRPKETPKDPLTSPSRPSKTRGSKTPIIMMGTSSSGISHYPVLNKRGGKKSSRSFQIKQHMKKGVPEGYIVDEEIDVGDGFTVPRIVSRHYSSIEKKDET